MKPLKELCCMYGSYWYLLAASKLSKYGYYNASSKLIRKSYNIMPDKMRNAMPYEIRQAYRIFGKIYDATIQED